MFDKSKCTLCGDCLVRCQYTDYTQEKAIEDFKVLIEGGDAEILRQCITCAACNEYCREGANPFDLICELQEEKGSLPIPDALLSQISYLESMPSELIEGDDNKPLLSLCTTELVLPKGALQGQMFEGLTIAKGGKYFCYLGVVHLGKVSIVRENAKRFVDNIASLNKDEVVFLHDDCYTMLTKVVPDYGIEVPFKAIHIMEYLLDYLKHHQAAVSKLDVRIAYQRPCISRYTPETDAMLDELFEQLGVERVQRRHDQEDALCCGSSLAAYYPDKAARIQQQNLADAESHGAQAMVFTCPLCYMTLKKVCRDWSITPIFITELCQIALGERPFPSR